MKKRNLPEDATPRKWRDMLAEIEHLRSVIDEPCIVWQPLRMSGAATIGHTRLPAETIAGCVWHGGIASATHAYDVTPEAARLACWWLVCHDVRDRKWKRDAAAAWGTWAEAWHAEKYHLGPPAGDPPPAPPT